MNLSPFGQLILHNPNGFAAVAVEEIIFVESCNATTIVCLRNGEEIIDPNPLDYFESCLPKEMFCRVHHSFIINLKEIDRYVNNRDVHFVMSNGDRVPVLHSREEVLLNLTGINSPTGNPLPPSGN